jgi:hypothetical protein
MTEKHFNNNIAPVRSRGGSLVSDIETPSFYKNDLALSNTADVTGGKPIAS